MMSKKNVRTKLSSKSSGKKSVDSLDSRPQPTWKKWLTWLDDHILLILAGFLIAFIPLYPKIPLADLIPGYIVRLRLEDLFVAFTVGVLGIQVLRKKVEWRTPLTWFIIAYAIVGLLSTISAVVITQTVPAEPIHIGKSMLHYFRYLQYFSLFFISFAAIKTRKHLYILLGIIVATVLAISLYGYGQRNFYWPVYSTMNREFSKGVRLVLTEHARVQSTFGGHYDMSAFLVITLPIVLAMFFAVKKFWLKTIITIPFLAGSWLIIMGASRSSFGAFIVAVATVVGLFALQQPTWMKKIWWGISRQAILMLVLGLMFLKFGDSIYDRFLQTLEGYPALHATYHGLNDQRLNFDEYYIQPVAVRLGLAEMKMPKAERPKNSVTLEEIDGVMVPSDSQPKPARDLPGDVYEDIPDIEWVATEEAGVATVVAVQKPRTFSDNANRHGLSMAIRLDTLWPRAIQGFQRNPLLGSGYATLTKETVGQFTEAESTDNNFLRTLGETGLLGFLTFYGTLVVALWLSVKSLFSQRDMFIKAISIAYIAASLGLVINALLIDVFAASKVAFSFWAFTGIVIAALLKLQSQQVTKSTK